MLIYCVECEHQCSDKADACPQCGCPLKPPPAEPIVELARATHVTPQPMPTQTYLPYPPIVQTTEKTGKKWKAIQLVSAVGLIVSMGGCMILASAETYDSPASFIFSAGGMVAFFGLLFGKIGGWWYHG